MYKKLNVLNFDKLLTKCTLLVAFKHRNYLLIWNHNHNTRLEKNMNIYININKQFGGTSC